MVTKKLGKRKLEKFDLYRNQHKKTPDIERIYVLVIWAIMILYLPYMQYGCCEQNRPQVTNICMRYYSFGLDSHMLYKKEQMHA